MTEKLETVLAKWKPLLRKMHNSAGQKASVFIELAETIKTTFTEEDIRDERAIQKPLKREIASIILTPEQQLCYNLSTNEVKPAQKLQRGILQRKVNHIWRKVLSIAYGMVINKFYFIAFYVECVELIMKSLFVCLFVCFTARA